VLSIIDQHCSASSTSVSVSLVDIALIDELITCSTRTSCNCDRIITILKATINSDSTKLHNEGTKQSDESKFYTYTYTGSVKQR